MSGGSGEKRKPRWKRIDVGDTLLTGATEGGFVELEELDASDFPLISNSSGHVPQTLASDPSDVAAASGKRGHTDGTSGAPRKRAKAEARNGPGSASAKGVNRDTPAEPQGTGDHQKKAGNKPHAETGGEAQGGGKKKKKNKKKGKEVMVSGDGHPGGLNPDGLDEMAALRNKLARLESENAALRRSQREAAAPVPSVGKEMAPGKKKKEKKGKRKQDGASSTDAVPQQGAKKAKLKGGPKAGNAGLERETIGKGGEASPLVNVMAWERFELDNRIMAGIARLGFERPTPIQEACLLPAIRDRRDVIGAAQTGSGKTLAFGLPILQLLLAERNAENADTPPGSASPVGPGAKEGGGGGLRALIMTPTRELALQVCEHLQALAKGCGIWVVPVVGGLAAPKQERLLKRGPEVVVATPGRLWEVFRNAWPGVSDVRRLTWLVLDEADRMVQQGHFQELTSILGYIDSERKKYGAGRLTKPSEAADDAADAVPSGEGEEGREGEEGGAAEQPEVSVAPFIQTFVFSATLTLPEKLRARLARGGGGASGSGSFESLIDRIRFRGKPKIVDLTNARRVADKVEEAVLYCSEAERDALLYYLLATHSGRTLVFVNAISAVRRVAALLRLLGVAAAPLHASMQQRQRLKALDRFRANDDAVLIATDVAARGLDIAGVRCVIHYQVAASADTYVHRSGRTARAEEEGLAVSLVSPKDTPRFAALLKALGREEPPSFPVDPAILPAAERRMKLAVRLDEQQRVQAKAGADATWRRRQAEVLELELSEEEGSVSDGDGGRQKKRPSGAVSDLQQELASLIAEPLQPSFSRRFFTGRPSAAAALGFHHLAAAKGEGSDAGPGDGVTASGVTRNVTLAQSLTESRQVSKSGKAGGVSKSGGKKKKGIATLGRQATDAELLAHIMEKKAKKKAGKRRMVVIPPAFARTQSGPDALSALRTSLNR